MRYNWFRLWHEIIYDPKIRRLPVPARWLWITLLCLASMSPRRGVIEGFDETALRDAAAFGTDEKIDVQSALKTLAELRMIRRLKRGWRVVNFERRQYDKPSDRPNAVRKRVLRYRRNAMKRGRNANETPMRNALETRLKRGSNALDKNKRREEKRVEEKEKRVTTRENNVTTFAPTDGQRRSPPLKVVWSPEGFIVPQPLLDRWGQAYPAVDVAAEVRAAFEWAAANPARKKSNWTRFLVNWLKRSQDRARVRLPVVTETPEERAARERARALAERWGPLEGGPS